MTPTDSKEWPYIGGKVSLFSIYERGSPAFSKSSPSCYITDNFPQQRRRARRMNLLLWPKISLLNYFLYASHFPHSYGWTCDNRQLPAALQHAPVTFTFCRKSILSIAHSQEFFYEMIAFAERQLSRYRKILECRPTSPLIRPYTLAFGDSLPLK